MLTGRVARRFKCRLSPRGGPCGVLGDLPELEPGQPPVAAQHPYLAIKLAVTCPQGLGETPLGPSRAVGCPWPNYKPRRGDGQAPCAFYQAPYGRPRPRRHRRDPAASPRGLDAGSAPTYVRPARPALARRRPEGSPGSDVVDEGEAWPTGAE